MFLYFLSGLATFIDKISFFHHLKYKVEETASWLCFFACAIIVFLYIADSLNYIEITFKCDEGIYKVLMQGVPNSFFTFSSININTYIFLFALIIPFFYIFLCIISYLRDKNVTKDLILDIWEKNKPTFIKYLIFSIIFGVFGMAVCRLKYIYSTHEYGHPQYHKYFLLFFILFLFVSYTMLFHHYRKQIFKSNKFNEINSDNTIKS